MMARLYAATKSDAQLPQSCRAQVAPRQQETLTQIVEDLKVQIQSAVTFR